MIYANANFAFLGILKELKANGVRKKDSIFIPNYGFYIMNPMDNEITCSFRRWNKQYADREYKWYLSRNRSVKELKKYAKIWDNMHSGDDIVNSNYGYQWNRENQLGKIVEKLIADKETRQAVVTIYDGKEQHLYKYDTPCTLNIGFSIQDSALNMTVIMRSNDVWYGFCNDQYCFSSLQRDVASLLRLQIGWYYHFAMDMHIYKEKSHFLSKINL